MRGNILHCRTELYSADYQPHDQLLVPVLFRTNHAVYDSSKQAVAVIGSTPDLGRWKAVNSRIMFEVEPKFWATIIYLPKGRRFRYKYVAVENSKHKVHAKYRIVGLQIK